MAESKLVRDQRGQFRRYKEDVKREGKPFYPYAMFHDTVMALVVVAVIIGLAFVWYFTARHHPTQAGTLGPLYKEKADPGTTSFVPRPDWYFYFLFYLLRIFKWPESVVLGTVGIPTILLILALALPFVDRRSERRLLRRPVAVVAAVLVVISMGVLTWKGAVAKESIASENVAKVPEWAKAEGFAGNADAVAGARIFASLTCGTCHTYLGSGNSNFGAPDLSAIGKGGRGVQGLADYVANPAKFGNTIMPSFASLGQENLTKIGTFLDASKSPK